MRSEQRRNRRYIVNGISGNVLYTSDVDVINISIEGTAIETKKRLELNREYVFKIKYQETFLNIKGRVAWATLISKEDKETNTSIPIYRVGIKFTNIMNDHASILQSFIKAHKISIPQQRLGGIRFQIVHSHDIKIDVPQEYKVKKISLSGMLVETNYSLALDSQHDIELFLNEQLLRTIGRVAYCKRLNGNNKKYRHDIGIEFTYLTDNNREILADFLQSVEK
jgi:hypothetical protein